MPLVYPAMKLTVNQLTGRHCLPLLTGFLIRGLLVAAVLSAQPPSQATLAIVACLMALHAFSLKLSCGHPALSEALAVIADLGLLLGMTTPNSLLAPWMILTGLTLSLANLVDQRPRAAIIIVTSLILLGTLGFDAAHADKSTELSMAGLRALYAFAPGIVGLLAAAAMIGYPLTEAKHAEILRQLGERDGAFPPVVPEDVAGTEPNVANPAVI